MDTNITFRIDSEVKAQMNAICSQLGMTASTAFNIAEKPAVISREKMLADADQLLTEFASDYDRMAK